MARAKRVSAKGAAEKLEGGKLAEALDVNAQDGKEHTDTPEDASASSGTGEPTQADADTRARVNAQESASTDDQANISAPMDKSLDTGLHIPVRAPVYEREDLPGKLREELEQRIKNPRRKSVSIEAITAKRLEIASTILEVDQGSIVNRALKEWFDRYEL